MHKGILPHIVFVWDLSLETKYTQAFELKMLVTVSGNTASFVCLHCCYELPWNFCYLWNVNLFIIASYSEIAVTFSFRS